MFTLMVRSASLRVSNHEAEHAAILRDGAEFIIGPRFARTRWRLLRRRIPLHISKSIRCGISGMSAGGIG